SRPGLCTRLVLTVRLGCRSSSMVTSSPREQTLPRLRRSGHAGAGHHREPRQFGPGSVSFARYGVRGCRPGVCDALTEAERVVCGKPKNRHVSPVFLLSQSVQADDAASLSPLTLVIYLASLSLPGAES